MLQNITNKYNKHIIDFLQKLIQTPSVNGVNNEGEIVKLICQECEKLKIPYKLIYKDKRRPNIFIGENFSKKIGTLLVAHTDTVSEGNSKKWKFSPFSGQISKGKIFGRGALDCKGGIAISLYTYKMLSDLGKNDQIKCLFSADEESGADSKIGIQYFLEKGLQAENVIYTYGGSDFKKELIIGHRGLIRLKIDCFGQSAHSGSL